MLPRVVEILAGRNLLRPGYARVNPDAIIPTIIAGLTRSTYAEAAGDTDGTYTVLPFEMLNRIFGIDIEAENPAVATALVEIYSAYMSTKADGPVQMALNGNGRSMLVDIPTTRNGQKFRSARFVTEDRLGVLRLNQTRVNRVITAARGANNMRVLSFTRQPELAGEINAMFTSGMRDVAMLMAPMPEPSAALPSGTEST